MSIQYILVMRDKQTVDTIGAYATYQEALVVKQREEVNYNEYKPRIRFDICKCPYPQDNGDVYKER